MLTKSVTLIYLITVLSLPTISLPTNYEDFEETDVCRIDVAIVKRLLSQRNNCKRDGETEFSKDVQEIKEDLQQLVAQEMNQMSIILKEMKSNQDQFSRIVEQECKTQRIAADKMSNQMKITLLEEMESKQIQFAKNVEEELKNVKRSLFCPNDGLVDLVAFSNGKKYFFSKHEETWYGARDFCKRNQMYLVIVLNEEELDILYKDAEKIFPDWVNWWVAASDVGQEPGTFKWSDGVPLERHSKRWMNKNDGHKEPNNWGKGKDACVMFIKGWGAKYLDDLCEYHKSFICQVPPECL